MTEIREVTRRFVLQVGFSCPWRCKFCYYRESLKKGNVKDFTTEEVKTKLREGRRLGKDQVDISGGEPSIRKDLFEIISYARKIGYKKVCMITNCFRTYDMNYVNRLIDAGLNDVLLSLHSPIEKEHDWLTQVPGSWKKVMKSLENFSKTKIEYRVNSTISDINYNNMDLFFKIIKPYKPHAYNLLVLNPTQETDAENGEITIKDYNKIGESIGKSIAKYKKDFKTINVRWIPFCMLKGNEEHVRTRWQKLYEDQEWDPYLNIKYNKGLWAAIGSAAAGLFLYMIYAPRYGKRGLYTKFNEMITTFRVKLYHRQLKECKHCSLRKICDALPANYVKTFNKTKLEPYKLGKVVKDPLHFCKEYKDNFKSLRISDNQNKKC